MSVEQVAERIADHVELGCEIGLDLGGSDIVAGLAVQQSEGIVKVVVAQIPVRIRAKARGIDGETDEEQQEHAGADAAGDGYLHGEEWVLLWQRRRR